MGSKDVIPEIFNRESNAFKINLFWIPAPVSRYGAGSAGMTPLGLTLKKP